ncbi:hypothetical protein MLD38_016657 [Melastoma candidum]|nr:hypothetical protein MLD38_016657 [Melastoma candidum]
MNPFGVRAVRLYLRDVRDTQAKARGIAYEKKRRKRPQQPSSQPAVQQDHRYRHGHILMHDPEMDSGGDSGI